MDRCCIYVNEFRWIIAVDLFRRRLYTRVVFDYLVIIWKNLARICHYGSYYLQKAYVLLHTSRLMALISKENQLHDI